MIFCSWLGCWNLDCGSIYKECESFYYSDEVTLCDRFWWVVAEAKLEKVWWQIWRTEPFFFKQDQLQNLFDSRSKAEVFAHSLTRFVLSRCCVYFILFVRLFIVVVVVVIVIITATVVVVIDWAVVVWARRLCFYVQSQDLLCFASLFLIRTLRCPSFFLGVFVVPQFFFPLLFSFFFFLPSAALWHLRFGRRLLNMSKKGVWGV